MSPPDPPTTAAVMKPHDKRGRYLLVEGRKVRADVEVGLHGRLVDVLQTVPVGVHDETRVVVEQHAHAVVTELVA